MTPTDNYISREEVMKEFVKMKEGFTEDSDYATGIKSGIDACIYRVVNTPTLPDKSIQIRDMIKGKIEEEKMDGDTDSEQNVTLLEELLIEIDSL